MKSSHRLSGIIAALAAVCIVSVFTPQPARAQPNEDATRVSVVEAPVIVVKGVGNKTVQSDRTSLGVAANAEASTLHGALDALQAEMARIRKSIAESADDELEVSEWPANVGEYLNAEDEHVFIAHSGFQFVAPTLARAKEIIESMEASGHLISNIRFAKVDHGLHSRDVYALAIEDARRTAGEVAAATGMRIGRLVRIEPGPLNSSQVSYPFNFNVGGLSNAGPNRGMMFDKKKFDQLFTLHEIFGPPEAVVTAAATCTFELLVAD